MLQILAKAAETFDDAYFFVNSHLTQADPYLYIGFGFEYEGEEWDFDNEIFGCSQTTEALLQGMDPDTRLTILRIKDERLHTRGGSWRGSSQPDSLDIYRAVFDSGAQTLAECETWLVGHPGTCGCGPSITRGSTGRCTNQNAAAAGPTAAQDQ